ncbi:Eco57I restriction-modification methylase domain-containing protein [Halalkalibacter urbisdiaboli]|uniref:Eco57I restriction-modification methylase domain-containing protein n=1 Tax=Halalkalibacter urbisdiaboli TaxID=1960589 RepID=UPI000B449422|nr:N-6 DNA methylase [Halalkalibacter urbisdiaboli]
MTTKINDFIESQLIRIFLKQIGFNPDQIQNTFLKSLLLRDCPETEEFLLSIHNEWTLKNIEEQFYSLLSKETLVANGIIFTPEYIIDYILSETMGRYKNPTVCDFSCGCGAFLVRAAEHLQKENPSTSMLDILKTSIFGMDILAENVRRTKIILTLLALKEYGDVKQIQLNIICYDSTQLDAIDQFNHPAIKEGFDCIVGNPPYVRIQDLTTDVRARLKKTYKTATSGSFNLYFAFFELGIRGLQPTGTLGYIVPNYFLKMKAAEPLREILIKNRLVKKVIDFNDNLLFSNAHTYSAIIMLDHAPKDCFEYSSIKSVSSRTLIQVNQQFKKAPYEEFTPDAIHLLTEREKRNINRIEHAGRKLAISTGIATQKDALYMIGQNKEDSLDEDDSFFYKWWNGDVYPIEKSITVPLIKGGSNIDFQTGQVKKNISIIYPYRKTVKGTIEVIPEHELMTFFPNVYRYLETVQDELAARNNGKPKISVWYEYGRKQALGRFGPKIISPTNAKQPRFTLFEDYALFNNGYAIYGLETEDDDQIPNPSLPVLTKILNSSIMDYYIQHTSYLISGGYYCYQKKYIRNFSIPPFTNEELSFIEQHHGETLDAFLSDAYKLEQ